MTDPLTLGALGATALSEGIKFLYGQASDLLKANRERRRLQREGERAPDRVTTPDIAAPVLDAPLESPTADLVVVDAEQDRIAQLAATLSVYALGQLDIPDDDRELRVAAGEMRALIEAVYGRHITFSGEERERTGTSLVVEQYFGEVGGEVTGVDADLVAPGAEVSVKQTATTTGAQSSIVGAKIGKVGGREGEDHERAGDGS